MIVYCARRTVVASSRRLWTTRAESSTCSIDVVSSSSTSCGFLVRGTTNNNFGNQQTKNRLIRCYYASSNLNSKSTTGTDVIMENSISNEDEEISSSSSTAAMFFNSTTIMSENDNSNILLPPSLGSMKPPSPTIGSKMDQSISWKKKQSKFISYLYDVWSSNYSWQRHYDRSYRAEAMFQACTIQSQKSIWYYPNNNSNGLSLRSESVDAESSFSSENGNSGMTPYNFRCQHALLTLHIWLLQKRLLMDIYDPNHALQIQEELFNILWLDTISRLRQAGIVEFMVNKNLLQVQQYTFLHLTHYDHCFTELMDKPEERLIELRRAIWSHIYIRNESMLEQYGMDYIDRIVWYIEANYQNIICHWPDEYYREARVVWVNIPTFPITSQIMDEGNNNSNNSNQDHHDTTLPEPWLRNITVSGIYYYWNPINGQSSWDKPQQ